MLFNRTRTGLCAGVAAVVVAVSLVLPLPVHAESPLDFFRNQVRRAEPERAESAPQAPRRGGFFSRFFEFKPAPRRAQQSRPPQAPQLARAHRGFERVTCRRICDGEEFALGIQPKTDNHDEARAMCTAAGAGLETELVVQDFVAGAGFTPVMAATPLQNGRASSDGSAAAGVGGTCGAASAPSELFMVPLLHDATLRRGDIVATPEGFKVFVGRGAPPFKEADFLDNDDRTLPKDVRGLEIAVR
jgi:hypothetical protein